MSVLVALVEEIGDALFGRRQQQTQEVIVARLDVIKAALDEAQSTAADEAAQVQAHIARLTTQVTELTTSIDALTAAQVTDEEIEALRAQAAGIAATVEAIDTEGE